MMDRYAAFYAVERDRFVSGGARTAEAAARLAHYCARRAVRSDGRQPAGPVDFQVATSARVNGIPLFGEDLVVIRVVIETVEKHPGFK